MPNEKLPDYKRPFMLHIETNARYDLLCIVKKHYLPVVTDLVYTNGVQVKNYLFMRAPTCQSGRIFPKKRVIVDDLLMTVVRFVMAVRGLFQQRIIERNDVLLIFPKEAILEKFVTSRCVKGYFTTLTITEDNQYKFELVTRVWTTLHLKHLEPWLVFTDLGTFRKIVAMSGREFKNAKQELSSNVSLFTTQVSNGTPVSGAFKTG